MAAGNYIRCRVNFFFIRVNWVCCSKQHNTTLLSSCGEICLLARHGHKTLNAFYSRTCLFSSTQSASVAH